MEVKLRGLDRYEVEAIQYDGTNSDEICQFILEHTWFIVRRNIR